MMHWLEIARNQAEQRFAQLPYPTSKDENYRFTNLDKIPMEKHSVQSMPAVNLDEGEAALLLLQAEDGECKGNVGSIQLLDMQKASVGGFPIVQEKLKSCPFIDDKFAFQSAARWKNGAFVHIPAAIKGEAPLRILVRASQQEENFRHLFVLGEASTATIILEHEGDDNARELLELLEVVLEKNAYLHLVLVSRHGKNTNAILRHHLSLQEGAVMKISLAQVSGRKSQLRQVVELDGQQAEFEQLGAVSGQQEEHFDLWSEVLHQAPKSKSAVELFFVQKDKSKAIFNGLVKIPSHAPNCEAHQKSRSLLLSSQATAHAIPKLIIQTDEVKCSHGASVSTVQPEQIHYLQSRGIPFAEAEQMIVRGFTEVVFSRMPTEGLYARVAGTLEKRGPLQ